MHGKKNLVTAALPYANGPLHIGHIAGCYLPSDIYVRFLRLAGEDVKFVCGSDEHGVPITIKARNEQTTPQEIVNRYHGIMSKAFEELGISFDIYSRTSAEDHHQTASEFFKHLHQAGVFTEKETEQYYDPVAKQFLADRYIIGTCPKCGHDSAYGDQCESCGASLNPTDLMDPTSTLSGAKPELRSTLNWFLPLDAYQDRLQNFIASKKSYWKSNVYGQCMSWLQQGLQPRAMTRDLDWGVPVPVAGAESKVLYVWFDAPIGYITATKQLLGEEWKDYWQGEDSRIVHFIGKDNIVFHCIIFPAMLMAHGDYQLPENVPANEFLNLEGKKISTSRNWAVWVHEYLEDFPGKMDELRYVLTSIAPETGDSEFTWSDFQARVNNELVAILGNLVNRVMVLYQKYFDGVVAHKLEAFSEARHQEVVDNTYANVEAGVRQYRFKQALTAGMDLARHGNRYLTETEPWKLAKDDMNAARVVLDDCLLLIAHLRNVLQPFLPFTSEKLHTLLGETPPMQNGWNNAVQVQEGTKLPKPFLLFSKIEDEDIEKQRQKLAQSAITEESQYIAQVKETVQFPDFKKMDMRVGKILSAEKVKKADKLLHLKVDVGVKTVELVSGIAEHYQSEDLPGTTVTVLLNLEPRKIRGIMSEGMILMAEGVDGKLRFLQAVEGATPGEVIG
jgi:methionyl-tRNA synthetase